MFRTDKLLKVEQVGRVWRAQYDGVTICSCATKSATERNAEFLMQSAPIKLWQALVAKPIVGVAA